MRADAKTGTASIRLSRVVYLCVEECTWQRVRSSAKRVLIWWCYPCLACVVQRRASLIDVGRRSSPPDATILPYSEVCNAIFSRNSYLWLVAKKTGTLNNFAQLFVFNRLISSTLLSSPNQTLPGPIKASGFARNVIAIGQLISCS